MKAKYIMTLVFAMLFYLVSPALDSKIEEAQKAYEQQNYDNAIELYKELVSESGTSPELLFNLGNAYYQKGDYGNAMLSYLRANKLDPSGKEIKENILYLSNKIEDANKAEQKGKKLNVKEDDLTFFQSIHQAVAKNVSSNVWAVWGAIGFFMFLVSVAIYLFTKEVILRKAGFFGGLFFISAAFICVLFAFIGASAYDSEEEAVLTAYKTRLQTEAGKDDKNTEGNILTRGTKVKIVSAENDASGNVTWYKIRLNSDYIGWVPAEDIEII